MSYKVVDGKLVKMKGGKEVHVRKIRSYVDQTKAHGAHRNVGSIDHVRLQPVPNDPCLETRVAPVQPRRENGCAYPVAPEDFPEDKGIWDGACNRSACLKYPAKWYNRGSYAFYCEECALMLNDVNKRDSFCRDAPLCYHIPTQAGTEGLHVSPHSRVKKNRTEKESA